jgi:hypothetical protein
MAEKPLAHEYHLAAIKEEIILLAGCNEYGAALFEGGKLAAHIDSLVNMRISEEHREEVVSSLRDIRNGSDLAKIGELLSEDVLAEILAPAGKAEETISKRCSICGRFLAPHEGVGSKHGLICETGCLL